MAIPNQFNADGFLEPETYEATFEEIRSSILVNGDGRSETWDQGWRSELVNRVEVLTKQLWDVGVEDIFLDGSFVEDKDHPNDIDGYFDPHLNGFKREDLVKLEKLVSDLNDIDPHKVWDWSPESRKAYRGYPKKQLPMWLLYRVEFYPHINGWHSGITDEFGHELTFPSAFRQSRSNFKPKGIVKVLREAKND